MIACEVCCAINSDKSLIRLLDGKELEIKSEHVFPLSREERRAILEDEDELAAIAQIYALFMPESQLQEIDAIIALEFSLN